MSNTEKCLTNGRGLVYYLGPQRDWQAQGEGYSRISIYHNTTSNMYRVVAMSIKSNKAVINSRVTKDMQLKKDNATFFQWADSKIRYGINFSEEPKGAEFEQSFNEVLEKVKAEGAEPPGASPRRSFPLPPTNPSAAAAAAPPPAEADSLSPGGTISPRASPRGHEAASDEPQQPPSPGGGGTRIVPAPPSSASKPSVLSGAFGGRGAPVASAASTTSPSVPARMRPPPPTALRSSGSQTDVVQRTAAASSMQRTNSGSLVFKPATPSGAAAGGGGGGGSGSAVPPLGSSRPTNDSVDSNSASGATNGHSLSSSSPSGSTIVPPPAEHAPEQHTKSATVPSQSPSSTGSLGSTGSSVAPPPALRTPPAVPTRHELGGSGSVSTAANSSGTIRPLASPNLKRSQIVNPEISREPPPSLTLKRSATVTAATSLDAIPVHPIEDLNDTEAVRGKIDDVDLTPALRSAMDVLLAMLKEQDSLFEKRTDQVPGAVMAIIKFLESHALDTEDIFGYRVSRLKTIGLLTDLQQGKSLPEDTDPHLVAEMLKISFERLPRRPFHFERYEPPQAFNDLKSPGERSNFLKSTLATIDPTERQLIGVLVALMSKVLAHSSRNSTTGEGLASLLAPLVVEGRWLNYKQPPVVRLRHTFVI